MIQICIFPKLQPRYRYYDVISPKIRLYMLLSQDNAQFLSTVMCWVRQLMSTQEEWI